MIAKYVPLNQKAERVQWDEWVRHGSVKIHSPVEAAKIRQQVPRERRLHSRFAYRNENEGLLGPARNSLAGKAKARLVIQGQHCPDNAQGLVRTDAPTAHRTVVSTFLQIVSSMGWCRSLKGCGRVMCLSTRKTSRIRRAFVLRAAFTWLAWNRERCLDRNCKRCFWIARFSPWMAERTA